MAMSPFLARLRAKVGNDLLMLPSVNGCVFDSSGRLLMARHGDVGLWATPGGGVDPGERPEEAVVRELREELAIDVEVRGLIGVYGGPEFHTVYPNGHEVSYMIAMYACVVASGTPTPDGDEITDWRWVREQEVGELTTTAWTPYALPDAFAWWREHAA
ncbi:MAG: NUDIX domain-containing protein [Nonomuraea sp.]|nr:NUDIX domain-containing protein [Nonomuraea sp.]NUP63616.1 NUDIX domain-containing protein [Nonomuraea sp.]NUP78822.1 NUDIX domain-containing protein [Nonomuraea sp.]